MDPVRIVRNFRVEEEIGTGSTGVIYRAVQTTLDRAVALKELHPHLAKNPEFIRRFEREAKTAATLQHENIIGVIDFGQEGTNYFIALEFVDGPDLKTVMQKAGRLPIEVSVSAVLEILRGLEHAHARGIVHRDIKPANVMVSREGVVKIADFSTAQASQVGSMTVTGAMMGTPAYMSPEQVSSRPVDARTDLFSAGVVLYEMLSGIRPFDGDSYPTIVNKLLTFTPRELDELDPSIPAPIAKVARKSLQKDIERRYRSAKEFREDLEQAAAAARVETGRGVIERHLAAPRAHRPALTSPAAAPPVDPPVLPPPAPSATAPAGPAATTRPAGRSSRILLLVLPLSGLAAAAFFAVPALRVPGQGADPTLMPAPSMAAATTAPAVSPTVEPEPAPTAVAVAPPPKKVRYGDLRVVVDPWAKVYVDGKYVATTPIASPLRVEAGTRTLRLEADGYRSHEEKIEIRANKRVERTVKLRSLSAAYLSLKVTPWANVYVNGDHVGSTPLSGHELDPGAHSIVLRNPSCREVALTVQAAAGKNIARELTLTCDVP